MGYPVTRFTFFNEELYPDGIVVNEPIGWKDASISLERDKSYQSLVEYFKGNFIWFGQARNIIREIEDTQGLDAELRVLIEINFGAGWEELFDGLIDISQIEDISKSQTFYKSTAPIIRNDFWAKFINRKSTPVNLSDTTDLDGNARSSVEKITLPLPSQKLRKKSHYVESVGIAYDQATITSGDYLQLGFDLDVLNEAKNKFTLLTDINSSLPVWVFSADEEGEYTFDPVICMSVTAASILCDGGVTPYEFLRTSTYVSWFIQKNDETAIELDADDNAIPFTKGGTRYSISQAFDLKVNDVIRIYGVVDSNAWEISPPTLARRHMFIWGRDNTQIATYQNAGCPATLIDYGDFPEELEESSLRITADTIYPESESDAFLIKDAAESIISKLVGQDASVKSDFLDECQGLNAIARGQHIRGYSFDDRPFFMSFDDWWEGAAPLLNLGLGYTEVGGVKKIEIEDKAYFWNNTPVVNFSNVGNLERTYDQDKIFKTIEIGFAKWSSESDSGIDDPQTKHIYRTRFSTTGTDFKALSKWLAASLAIERSRRNRVILGQDDRNDEEIVVIAVQEYEGGYTPEFSENFEAIAGLLNSDFRYNIRHTPARILLRWINWLNGCLQHTTGESFKFASGEGNYQMSSKLAGYDCEFNDLDDSDYGLTENQDIQVTNDALFVPRLYKVKVPMTWETYKQIRDNRTRAVGISTTSENHTPMFILDFDYKIWGGFAEMSLILGGLRITVETETGEATMTGYAPMVTVYDTLVNVSTALGQGQFNGFEPSVSVFDPE